MKALYSVHTLSNLLKYFKHSFKKYREVLFHIHISDTRFLTRLNISGQQGSKHSRIKKAVQHKVVIEFLCTERAVWRLTLSILQQRQMTSAHRSKKKKTDACRTTYIKCLNLPKGSALENWREAEKGRLKEQMRSQAEQQSVLVLWYQTPWGDWQWLAKIQQSGPIVCLHVQSNRP